MAINLKKLPIKLDGCWSKCGQCNRMKGTFFNYCMYCGYKISYKKYHKKDNDIFDKIFQIYLMLCKREESYKCVCGKINWVLRNDINCYACGKCYEGTEVKGRYSILS